MGTSFYQTMIEGSTLWKLFRRMMSESFLGDPDVPTHVPYSEAFRPSTLDYLITGHLTDCSLASITPTARQALRSDHEMVATTTTLPVSGGPRKPSDRRCRKWGLQTRHPFPTPSAPTRGPDRLPCSR